MDLHKFFSVVDIEVASWARWFIKVYTTVLVLLQTLTILFLCALVIAAGACVGIRWVL